MKLKSVKTKIIALVLCAIILSSGVIGGASIINSKRVVMEDSTQIMNLLCASRATEIDGLFKRISQSVETLTLYAADRVGDLERFKTDAQYVKQYSEEMLPFAINAAQNTEGAMTVYIRFNPEFTASHSGVFCAQNKADGSYQVITPTNISAYDPSDTAHVGWFYEPMKAQRGVWISPYFNENINVEMVSYSVPFYVEGTFVGVVGMDINFSVLQDIVSSTKIYDTGYAYLTDDQARVVYHKDIQRGTALTEFKGGEFREMAEKLIREQATEGLVSYRYGNTTKEAAFKSLANGMRLVLTAPVREIDAQANRLILQIAITVMCIVLLATGLTLVYTKRLVKPLQELNVAAKKIAAGDLSVSITHQSQDEVGALAESFRQTVEHLHKYITYINELAYRDSLTGVRNKTAYLEVAKRMDDMTRLRRPQYALIVFDINGLKYVNDHYGHDFGDMLIMDASRIICKVFKRSPVYRIGGDEFVVLLENTDYDHYVGLLEQFGEAVDEHNRTAQDIVKVSIAHGIAIFSEDTDLVFNDVFKRADSAMYRNKQEMKNRSSIHETS